MMEWLLADGSIFRDPAGWGYPELPAGTVRDPKFGYIFVENRDLSSAMSSALAQDGLDWVPSSTMNASSRMLCDGKSMLMRYYCARRTKSGPAKPPETAQVAFQREVYDATRKANPEATTHQLKSIISAQWRALPAGKKEPYQEHARKQMDQRRQRLQHADPAQLLVKHEMWLRSVDGSESPGGTARVLIHYLGDDAFQVCHQPPRPVVVRWPSSTHCSSDGGAVFTDDETCELLFRVDAARSRASSRVGGLCIRDSRVQSANAPPAFGHPCPLI